MKRKLAFTMKALGDLDNAHAWYESQSKGLGEEFFRRVEAAAARALSNPALYQKIDKYTRRILLKRSSYALYYRYDDKYVYVTAVWHLRRDPAEIEERLREAVREFGE